MSTTTTLPSPDTERDYLLLYQRKSDDIPFVPLLQVTVMAWWLVLTRPPGLFTVFRSTCRRSPSREESWILRRCRGNWMPDSAGTRGRSGCRSFMSCVCRLGGSRRRGSRACGCRWVVGQGLGGFLDFWTFGFFDIVIEWSHPYVTEFVPRFRLFAIIASNKSRFLHLFKGRRSLFSLFHPAPDNEKSVSRNRSWNYIS